MAETGGWQPTTPLATEDRPRRQVDVVALVAGSLFSVFAIVLMAVDVSLGLFRDGGLLWLVLVAAGVALLVTELRRARRRQPGN